MISSATFKAHDDFRYFSLLGPTNLINGSIIHAFCIVFHTPSCQYAVECLFEIDEIDEDFVFCALEDKSHRVTRQIGPVTFWSQTCHANKMVFYSNSSIQGVSNIYMLKKTMRV